MRFLRKVCAWFCDRDNQRDMVGLAGVVLLGYGGEQLHPGAGLTAAGAVLTAIAALVH